MYTPEIVTHLNQNEIFVFGSNNLGQHAGGAAFIAVEKFGAVNKMPIGLQGNSYAIITTSFNDQTITADFIKKQINVLYQFAKLRPDLTFYVTKIGCGIAGMSIEEIAQLFFELEYCRTENVIIPKEFVEFP